MKEKINFDMKSSILALHEGIDFSSKDGIFTPRIKQLTEAAMQVELEEPLRMRKTPIVKNAAAIKPGNPRPGAPLSA